MKEDLRRIVLVSGAPGAGKTTLAVPLAAALGYPLLAKDDVKEAIWDALSLPVGDIEWSRRVGGAAMEAMWAVAARCPEVVLEATFRPESSYERQRLEDLDATIVEVHASARPRSRRGATHSGRPPRTTTTPTPAARSTSTSSSSSKTQSASAR